MVPSRPFNVAAGFTHRHPASTGFGAAPVIAAFAVAIVALGTSLAVQVSTNTVTVFDRWNAVPPPRGTDEVSGSFGSQRSADMASSSRPGHRLAIAVSASLLLSRRPFSPPNW